MKLSSPAFRDGEAIPPKYTCKGDDLSPPLEWTGAPPESKSFALIMSDPDAPGGHFLHWMIFNLPSKLNRLEEGIPGNIRLANGAVQGRNDFGQPGYGGPCPPPGRSHRYVFELFALDTLLDARAIGTEKDLRAAMKGHELAHATLTGLFRR